jgi:hypothetical protein
MAVSVPQQPTASSLRVFFFLYVCFCLAISTVFQAFFVSYLVEPNYEKRLKTFEDLLHSDVVLGYHPGIHIIQDTLECPEFVKLLEHKKSQKDCSDVRECIERIITKRDIATFMTRRFASYVALQTGTVNVGKLVCFLDELDMDLSLIVLFKKGNPFLNQFDTLMRRYLEAGLHEGLWTELQHGASLKGGGRIGEAAGDTFFPFSISHLQPAFVVLLVGNVLSCVVFIGELIVNCLRKWRG